ncbi:MAG: FAD-dependent oxidoreductase [Anaerolineales bacterium]|nr:FAD-dependent oxidoreductase [Anaerolineales bacterium]
MMNIPAESLPVFPNYLQLRSRSRIPARLWAWLRGGSVVALLAMVVLLLIRPETGLFVFWRVTVPVLPLVFWIAPGIWRNICPLAAVNQTPRLFKFTRGWTVPAWFKEYGYVIGFVAFFLLASSRKWLFNTSGTATALLLIGALAGAFLGGYFFKGKSGWCSSICPLYPIQRLYNQTPFVTVPNAHCDPCVGCTKNCYDFNPGVAYLADLYDEDRYHGNYRKFFAAAMPGFIVAYFTITNPPAISIGSMYLQFGLYIVLSIGLFFLLDAFLKVTTNKLTAVSGAVAINLFYGFGLPGWLNAVGSMFGATPPAWVAWVGQVAIAGVAVAWVIRTYRKEPMFLGQLMQQEETRIAPGASRVLKQAIKQDKLEVTFMPNEVRVLVEAGRTLLEIAESNHQPIEAGCRMGMCGADPILILSGQENLSPKGGDERGTLERLGLGEGARLACMCRVKGAVAVSLDLKSAKANGTGAGETGTYDETIKSVVIVGNGIAGVTAADYVRRRHPACEIHLIGRESHHLYNRMAITRLVYGRSAMSGLYLQPETWYDERKITSWLNTQVANIDATGREVILATNEKVPYDRLILANGSSSFVPPIPGFGIPGTYVLREAEDAIHVRAYVQTHRCHHAVIAGGGLLGLEAGYALHKIGMEVMVLERGEWLLRRQLDARGSQFLRQYLETLGMDIVLEAETASVQGLPLEEGGRLAQVTLKDGRVLHADVFLAAVGIQPNLELGRTAGLTIKRGIVVDEAMRTSDPNIFAAGDVCEFNGKVPGLWTVAVEQARIAALNAVGGNEIYREVIPVTALKVVGVDVTSIGQFEAQADTDTVIVLEDTNAHRYRKLVLADGKIVGAILLGYPQYAPSVTAAVKQGILVNEHLDALQAGNWEVLEGVAV